MAAKPFANCGICDIDFQTEHNYSGHFTSKRHIKGLECMSSIYFRVNGMDFRKSEDAREVMNFARRYGEVKQSTVDIKGSWIIAQFEEVDSANKILAVPQNQLILDNGCRITTISRKKNKFTLLKEIKEQSVKEMKEETSEFDLPKLFKNCFSVEEQIDVLIKEIDDNNTEEDAMRRQAVCDELCDALTVYLPHTTVEVFGSSVNGLGVKASDIDMTVLFNFEKYDETQGPCVSRKSFPYFDEVDIKTVNLQNTDTRVINVQGLKDLVNGSRSNAIILLNRLISSENTGFTKLVNRAIGGRVPVIKAYHGGTNIPCDIVCENRLGLRNSQLLKLYQEIDPRVRPLLRTIRLLGTRIGFSGSMVSKTPTPKITNYCLYMMVLYYLQNTQPPVLPTVEELANLAEGSDRVTLDSYDASYTTDLSKIRRPTNYSSLKKLLCDFFMFFTDFDFTYYVICPRTGKALPILEIDQYCHFKEGVTFKPKVIHVQDPFVLDQNIAGNTNKYTLNVMQSAFRKCTQLILAPTFGEQTLNGNWGLTALCVKVDGGGETKGKANDTSDTLVTERALPDGRQLFCFNIQMQERQMNHCFQPLTHRANVIALKQWYTYRIVNAILCMLEGPLQGTVVPEAENLEDLVAEYHRIEAQRLMIKRDKVKSKTASTEGLDGPLSKRIKLANEDKDAMPFYKVAEKPEPKSNFGVFYSPVEKDAATNVYSVNMQKIFSPEQYGKKQLLFSGECKLYSRTDDLFFSRNKIRGKMVENEGMEHVLHDTEQFCAFETEVTKRSLCEVMKGRSKNILAVESEPVMEFHTHISVINYLGEQLSVEVEMENDRKETLPDHKGFCESLVVSFKKMLMKIVKHFPL